MRPALPVLFLLAPALAHELTSFGESGGQANFTRLVAFTLAFLLVLLLTAFLGYRRAKSRGGGEVVWAIFPTVVVAVVGAMILMAALNFQPVGGARLKVEITGQRYWWAVRYPERGIVTAGELWVPVGQRVELRATSRDVFYSLSIPGLGVKIDAVPGQTTRAWFTAKKAGIYGGRETEYVGPSTDKMRLRVFALPQGDYQRLVTAIRNYAGPRPEGSARRGKALFLARCAGCHTVRGTPARGATGPDLSLFRIRTTFGSGVWPNREDFLATWIANAPGMKPGVHMPAFPDLSPKNIQDLIAFLKTLGPTGVDLSRYGRLP